MRLTATFSLLAALAAIPALAFSGPGGLGAEAGAAPAAPAAPGAAPSPALLAHQEGTFGTSDVLAGLCPAPEAPSLWTGHIDRELVTLHKPSGAEALALDLSWTPVNPTAERLRFALVQRESVFEEPLAVAEGASPLHWEISGTLLDRLPDTVRLFATVADCGGAPVSYGALEGQSIAYQAAFLDPLGA